MNIPETSQQIQIEKRWKRFNIQQKISIYTVAAIACVALLVTFNIWVIQFSLGQFDRILDESSKYSNFLQTIEKETECFKQYVEARSLKNESALKKAMEETGKAIEELPEESEDIGEERYALTVTVKDSYEAYVEKRDDFLVMTAYTAQYMEVQQEIKGMQEALSSYAAELVCSTQQSSVEAYEENLPLVTLVPMMFVLAAFLLILCMMELGGVMYQTIMKPIGRLIDYVKRIGEEGFFIEDIEVENDDELGELTRAFNTMKFASCEYILAMEENQKTWELLHKEELEKLEVERRLETMKLEVLINQVNPHFLFNSLNVIGGMAMLENAETTEKMIMALSNLFRYNLKNSSVEAVLEKELNVVRDYMYIQQMRFGERLEYSIQCEINANKVVVPMFTFQPLIENAVIHGLSKKEESGRIHIRVWENEKETCIAVHDTGMGMSKEVLDKLKNKLADGNVSRDSIGVGNVYRRFKIMYPEGQFNIYSREEKGTLIKLQIPKNKREGD